MAFVKKEHAHPDKHTEIVLRNIGHEVLLHSEDSTSRVLPVKAINENTFRISFENSFSFNPDTLIAVVHQQLTQTDRWEDYTVSVNECKQQQTIFAYEVKNTSGGLKPCRGRVQQKGCYVIDISFPAEKSFAYSWLLLVFVPVAFAGLYFARRHKTPPEPITSEPVPDMADHKKLGDYIFFESTGLLSHNGEDVGLSAKEAKALRLLISNQNEVVERELLMKEIWEDEGVLVITRNVDVLMSKLRKRLSADPSVKIVNVHGKGYKLILPYI
ncbi:winged helix-turn-helix domain-containing protein [Chitinophaga sedimenti]|uniref:winged helix-turn-helix domain-containing protein n=1 Tax=Chitinophaga sedimenti TaxID=2033606 RepID=UPI0020031B3E|nr:winged helix-turn-helix domain-containing protein [Chitinophaga sedimenti]MCK7558452.1 winged helix-turn-helix domain-containing protein [Chitinophaga sedimenti]